MPFKGRKMEFGDLRTSTDRARFSRAHPLEIYSRAEERELEEAHLRGEHSRGDDINMMEYHHEHHQQAATMAATAPYLDSPGYRIRASPNWHNHHMSIQESSQHSWARSRSVSSLSNSSCGSDSDTGGVAMMKTSAKSSPMSSSHSSSNNYDYSSQTDSGASSARTIASSDAGCDMGTDDRMQELSHSSTPTADELSEVFTWVDENNDGLISGADLRGFMSRVLAFEISESEAETLLLFYGNGRTLHAYESPGGRQRNGGGAVVDFEGFFSLYQCLCGEQASPEEQSMMAAASQVFDGTKLQSGRWV